VRDNITK